MSFIGLFLGLAYLGISGWLTLRILRLFMGPLAAMKTDAPMQIFVTDYYVLLGQIGVFTAPFLGDMHAELNPVLIPILIALLGFCWFGITRTLSKARIQKFAPRLLGQILFPFQVGLAAAYGFFTLPILIGVLFGALPVAGGALFAFLLLYALFSKASLLIANQADPQEIPPHSPNTSSPTDVPPAA